MGLVDLEGLAEPFDYFRLQRFHSVLLPFLCRRPSLFPPLQNLLISLPSSFSVPPPPLPHLVSSTPPTPNSYHQQVLHDVDSNEKCSQGLLRIAKISY